MTDLLSIGEMAARCGLSRSALRFYDECGLLRPAVTDGPTGYRYYQEAQVAQAVLVRRLRRAELPVNAVKEFLSSGPQGQAELLRSHLTGIEARLADARAVIEELMSTSVPDQPGGPGCTIAASRLGRALDQVLFAAATGGDRPELGVVLFECKEGSLRLVATDSYRLAIRDVLPNDDGLFGPVRGLVPLAAAQGLLAELKTATTCQLGRGADGGLQIALDGAVRAFPPSPHEFPDYEGYLSNIPEGHSAIALRDDLAAAFSGPQEDLATLHFSSQGLGVEIAGVVQAVPSTWDGPPVSVALNAGFVAEALSAQVGPDVALEVVAPLLPVTFRSADEGTLNVLVMPVRP